MIRVALAGERGKTGGAVAAFLRAAEDVDYVGGFGSDTDAGDFLAQHGPQVLVDFTQGPAARPLALAAVAAGAAPVVGSTGMSAEDVDAIEAACGQAGLGGVVAPNFSVGAVVMMWLAEKAAPYFDSVEIIEAHAATKLDKPSGTALATAKRLGGDPPIHSLRLPGIVADQEVVFGLAGQTLTIAHRTTSREAYGPGVLLAIKKVFQERRFYRGMDSILGLD
ncbi:MAG TPA: dihydrodipicolinate reductase C-terminal domain-containing protein [Candidatus Dormibacteraeota bacterium]